MRVFEGKRILEAEQHDFGGYIYYSHHACRSGKVILNAMPAKELSLNMKLRYLS